MAVSDRLEYTPTIMPCAGSRLRASKSIPDMTRLSRVSPVEKSNANPSRILPSLRSRMASEKSMVYVASFTSVSRNSTVRRLPLADIDGGCFCTGDTTTLFTTSSILIFSSKNILMRLPLKLSVPGAGFERTNTGGNSSRSPPSGRPIDAHAASSITTAAIHNILTILLFLTFFACWSRYAC
jgi:hypothetical protein